MKTLAFIVRKNEVIATVETELKNGTEVEYSYHKSKETMNADREYQLVNAKYAKISRAKKYLKQTLTENLPYASELNPGEFFIIH